MVNLAPSIVDEQFITGFAEGDGHADLKTDGYNTPMVNFSQRDENIPDYIGTAFPGGCLYPPYHPRDNWRLYYFGNNCHEILKALSKHVVSQAFLNGLNNALVRLGLPTTTVHTPTKIWLAGFWYADGTSSYSSDAYFHLTIGQKNPGVLNTIQKTFGGKVYETAKGFHLWKPEANTRVDLALEFLKHPHVPIKAERLRENLQRQLTKQYISTHPELLRKQV